MNGARNLPFTSILFKLPSIYLSTDSCLMLVTTVVVFPTAGFAQDNAVDLSMDCSVVDFPTAGVTGDNTVDLVTTGSSNALFSTTGIISENDTVNLSTDCSVVVFSTAGFAEDIID
jgi:hypothetical protein